MALLDEKRDIKQVTERLEKARKVLKIHQQTYGDKTEFYSDQIEYINALEGHLRALQTKPITAT